MASPSFVDMENEPAIEPEQLSEFTETLSQVLPGGLAVWVGAGALLVVLALVIWFVGRAGVRVLEQLRSWTQGDRHDGFWRAIYWGWWLLLVVTGVALGAYTLQLPWGPITSFGSRIAGWIGSQGMAVIIALVVTVLAYRMIGRVMQRITFPGQGFNRQRIRANTLKTVTESALKVFVVVIGGLFVLSNMGFNISTLLAGVGVAGLAVSFAAQTLIRDFLTGFFILLEDQYGVGDIVDVGVAGGTVEKLNLRITALRDVEGNLHVVPNGQITNVMVMTREWARSVIDVPVAYGSDLDRAIAVIKDEVQKLYEDPEWHPSFAAVPPEVWGVEKLADSGVLIRVVLNTQPIQQWSVGREFRRRIKNRLDAENIEIPFPHLKVYLANDAAALPTKETNQ